MAAPKNTTLVLTFLCLLQISLMNGPDLSMELHHHLTCTKGLKKKIYRFLKFWFIFGHYVLICSYIVMYLESDQQRVRASLRNQTFDVLEQMVNSSLYGWEDNKIDLSPRKMKKGLTDLMDLKDKANKWDPEWNLVNSIYYCSSLYTTVGYGDMVCRTFGGKLFSVLFIVSSVPLWLSILTQLGYFLHLLLFKLWSSLRGYCMARQKGSFFSWTLPMTPPLVFLALLTLLLMVLFSLLISYTDERPFLESIYFSVVTFSTVGLGDVAPKSNFAKLRCFLLTFTFGFSILSAWITNVADVIYARNFDSITLQQHHRKTTLDSAAANTGNTLFLRSHMQRAKFFRKKAKMQKRNLASTRNIYLPGFQRGQSSSIIQRSGRPPVPSFTSPLRLSWMPKNEADFYEAEEHEALRRRHDTFINRQKQVEMKSQMEVIINNSGRQQDEKLRSFTSTVVLRKATI